MNDEVFNSIKAKVYGHYLAAQNLPEYCKGCGSTLSPTDIGYDPYSNERHWVTYCCGTMDRYVEIVIDDS